MEQYQYVEGFQRLLTSLRLRCAACLSLQFFVLFEYIHYDIQHSFCIPNEKVVKQLGGLYSKRARLIATKSVLVYNKTYNPVGSNKVNHFSRRGRAPTRLTMKKTKSLLKKTRIVRLFVWKGILKNTPLSSKIHCCFKNIDGSYLNRYRSNCKSVRFLLSASPKLVRKQGKVYLSSQHNRKRLFWWGEVSK